MLIQLAACLYMYLILTLHKFVYVLLYQYLEFLNPWRGRRGRWIYNYLCNQCLSPLMLWIRILLMERCTRYNSGLWQAV